MRAVFDESLLGRACEWESEDWTVDKSGLMSSAIVVHRGHVRGIGWDSDGFWFLVESEGTLSMHDCDLRLVEEGE